MVESTAQFTVDELVHVVSGSLTHRGQVESVVRIVTDSRQTQSGDCFVALHGESFDGNEFAVKAAELGAVCLIVEREIVLPEALTDTVSVIVVDDGLYALGEIAREWRQRKNVKIVAITGSNGKTTTKEMTAACLAAKYPVLKTKGNLNNRIGMPMTLLGLRQEKVAVLEMGMNEPGEIARLAEIAQPDLGVITNVHEAHLEGLGSLEKVAQAKGELFQGLGSQGIAIVNLDDSLVVEQAKKLRCRIVSFSQKSGAADLFAENVVRNEEGSKVHCVWRGREFDVEIPVPGAHNVSNALAALSVGLTLGLSVVEVTNGLGRTTIPGRRLKVHKRLGAFSVIDDCYNANPSSVEAGLRLLKELSGNRRRVAMLGDMRELGSRSAELHRWIGLRCSDFGVDALVTVGEEMNAAARSAVQAGLSSDLVRSFASSEEAADQVMNLLKPGDWVLVKGSRGMHMETVMQRLEAQAERG